MESLSAYNSGPSSARIAGRVKLAKRGSADFASSVLGGEGLRVDAVAGPFGTPVFSLACAREKGCKAYVPSRGVVYVDPEGAWSGVIEKVLLGRVPLIGDAAEGWLAQGGPILLLRGPNGLEERIEMDPANLRPERIFLGRPDEEPLLRISYGEYGLPFEGHPFPRRIGIALRSPPDAYEVDVRRLEAAGDLAPSTFSLSLPPGTREEIVKGKAAWNDTGIPFWPMTPTSPTER